ncbi:PNGase F N-terminal domain-containing protein [Marinilabiliaceae bacterium ANBcel2]|nr:PNGase F N-terminal domain-containing protein [Marinilabiliaceae bacterium ANBcel2]
MMLKNFLLVSVLVATFFSGCTSNYKEYGDKTITLFENELVHFSPGTYDNPNFESDEVVKIQDGRIILKRVAVPPYERDVEATLRVTFSSGGDPWDKSGSAFIVSDKEKYNLISIYKGDEEFPSTEYSLEGFPGTVHENEFVPVVELMRFMTPFGAISERTQNRRPVYIPAWEEEVTWEADVTDRISLMDDDFWIGIWADTWTDEGFVFSAELELNESPYPCAKRVETEVKSLLNTVYYIGGQHHVDVFAREDIVIDADIPADAENVKLYYVTTGHGGHSGGDEFTPVENIVKVNGDEVLAFTPWRDDCASFRRFNPSSGVWLREDTARYLDRSAGEYRERIIQERIASSDLSRSNWCPGSIVEPEIVELNNLNYGGSNEFVFSIPEAQEADGDLLNHWLVSAWLVWE